MSDYKKTALVLGAGGFIGSHMVKRLRSEGYWVRGVDLKYPEFSSTQAHEFVQGDLRDVDFVSRVIQFKGHQGNFYNEIPYRLVKPFDEIYQFAADMGGAGFVFTGENDADIMHNSVSINLNVLEEVRKLNETFNGEVKEWTEANRPLWLQPTKIFYSGSACMYPEHNQLDPDNPDCREESAYPANPDSEYGWEKLFSERLYFAYNRNYGIPVRVARYHNIFGPEGTWDGGREKAPAAICRKVAYLPESGGAIEVWGDGLQTRSFLFVDECIEATRRLMDSKFIGPVNIGSEEMVTINQLVETAAKVAGKEVSKIHIDGPLGVRGRNSNNDLIREKLGWDYSQTLEEGIRKTYSWISSQIESDNYVPFITPFSMSKLGPYASYDKETGFHPHPLHDNINYVGSFERLNVDVKGIIHVGLWDFVEHYCYSKLVGDKVIGVEANEFVFDTMSKPVADRCGYLSFNECVYSEDGLEKQFFLANDCSTLNPVAYSDHLSRKLSGGNYVKVLTKKLSTLIQENNIDMNQYDFLNIDAEGAELEILKGFEDHIKYINMIFIETSLNDRNNTGATHESIAQWLEERGFKLAEMSDSYQQEGWGDSIFLRNDRELEPFNKEKYLLK